jgi:heme-degrading monooxygenase HmoA
MILEVATLNVREDQNAEFEAAMRQALPIIMASPGYIRHTLNHCLENSQKYVFLVEWETLEAHTIGFRGSPPYQEWKRMLHHFYDPPATVEHYEEVRFGE